MRYVALLRGVNVGGTTLVKMSNLKTCFENLGFDGVSTYIASGNVLSESDEDDAAELAATIEAAIEQRLEVPVKVVVLDQKAYARIVKAIPKRWIGEGTLRANVAFLRRGTDAKQVVRELEPDPAIEEVKAVDAAFLWPTRRDSLSRSVMRKLIGGAALRETPGVKRGDHKPPCCEHGVWRFAGTDYTRKATKWRCPTGERKAASHWFQGRPAAPAHPAR